MGGLPHLPQHYLPFLPLRKLRRLSRAPESHKISSTRSRITLPSTWTSNPSEHALSYPNHPPEPAGVTSSVSSPSLLGMWTDGSRRSRCQKRVPLTTSGIYAFGSEGMAVFLRSFSNTPRGLQTRRRYRCSGMGGFHYCEELRSGGYPNPQPL